MNEETLPEFNEVYKNYIDNQEYIPEEILKATAVDNNHMAKEITGGAINNKDTGLPVSQLVLPRVLDHVIGQNNTRDRFFQSTFHTLRTVARKNVIISAIVNTRCQQVRAYSRWVDDEDKPGWKIKLKDQRSKMTKAQEKEAKEIADFMTNTGRTDFEGAEDREDNIEDIIEQIAREQQVIDQVAIECRYDKKGDLLDFWLLDAATIKRLRYDGFKGEQKWKFIQEIDGRAFTLYEHKDIVFDYQNKRADITHKGYGYAYTEMAIDAITAFMYGMSYNQAQFNHSSMPRGILTFKGLNLSRQQLEELQRQWVSMFSGVKGMWKTPILQNEADWKSIAPNNREMEFNQYIQLLASFICSVFGIDSAELGLRLNQAQNVLSENAGDKIAFSKDRGLTQLLSFTSTMLNKVMIKNEKWKDFCFVFTGVSSTNKSELLDLDSKQVKTYKTVNEKRKEMDLPPLPDGDILLDSVYMQAKQSREMNEQNEESEDGFDEGADDDMSDDDMDGILDDVFSDEDTEKSLAKSKKSQKTKIRIKISL